MGLSIRHSAMSGSNDPNVIRFISRSLAGQWPYEPEVWEHRRHPSLSRRLQAITRHFVMPSDSERDIRIAIEVIRRSAMLMLKDKDVRHFEVIPMKVENSVAVTHQECQGEGCEDCDDLGVLFEEAEGQYVPMMGWAAIIYVG